VDVLRQVAVAQAAVALQLGHDGLVSAVESHDASSLFQSSDMRNDIANLLRLKADFAENRTMPDVS
jgi:hypothetical protein